VLIIFSDGERETPLPIDLVRANKDLEVQIFSFLVGGGPDDANMKIVACENRGSSYSLPCPLAFVNFFNFSDP
jgi:hypothetical protein